LVGDRTFNLVKPNCSIKWLGSIKSSIIENPELLNFEVDKFDTKYSKFILAAESKAKQSTVVEEVGGLVAFVGSATRLVITQSAALVVAKFTKPLAVNVEPEFIQLDPLIKNLALHKILLKLTSSFW
jgi:hypothetical protein